MPAILVLLIAGTGAGCIVESKVTRHSETRQGHFRKLFFIPGIVEGIGSIATKLEIQPYIRHFDLAALRDKATGCDAPNAFRTQIEESIGADPITVTCFEQDVKPSPQPAMRAPRLKMRLDTFPVPASKVGE